jgi:hypothetical protein
MPGPPTLPARGGESASDAWSTMPAERQADHWQRNDAAAVLARSRPLPVPEPVPLRNAAWARWMYVVAVMICGPAQFVSEVFVHETDEAIGWIERLALFTPSLILLSAVAAWTWVNLENSWRVLAHSRFGALVSPWRGVRLWAALPVVGFVLIAAAAFVRERFILSSDRFGGDADVAEAFLVFGCVLVLLAVWVRPYLYLGRAMGRIRGDVSLFRRWLWMPVAATLLVVVLIIGLALFGSLQSGTTQAGAGVLILLLSIVPYLVWCITGWRAMSGMELTARARALRQREQRAEYLQLQRLEELRS